MNGMNIIQFSFFAYVPMSEILVSNSNNITPDGTGQTLKKLIDEAIKDDKNDDGFKFDPQEIIDIANQFSEGMSWSNHGLYGWHLDHIRPCFTFDLSAPEQQKECFNYKNLRPLWAKDNLSRPKK